MKNKTIQFTYDGKRNAALKINFMKLSASLIVLLTLSLSSNTLHAQSVGISGSSITPHASSILEIVSTAKGLLIPRMTTAERNAINSGTFATGLMIYNTDTKQFNSYNGTAWINLNGLTTTATAAGTTTLVVGSTYLQQFTGTTTQTVVLPDATGLTVGQSFLITNRSTGVVTVNANGGGLIQTMAAASQVLVSVVTIGTAAGTWDAAYSATSLDGLTDAVSGITNFANSLIIGHQTTGTLSTASNNTGIGYGVLQAITTGDDNTANGFEALKANTTGSNNTATGSGALKANVTAPNNSAFGSGALAGNTYASQNVAIGKDALLTQSYIGHASTPTIWATNNVAVGFDALRLNQPTSTTNGYQNTAIGSSALKANTTGSWNTASGFEALLDNTTGDQNTANGVYALKANTTGYNNNAIGMNALNSNTTGNNNTAIGVNALKSNTSGTSNIATGRDALFSNTAGTHNTASGALALFTNTGTSNTANGAQALYDNTTGSENTASGRNALNTNTTGTNNTAIGYNSDVSTSGLTNATAIGNGAIVTASNNMWFGNTSVVGWGFGVAPGSTAITVGSTTSNGNGANLTLAGTWTNASDSTKKHDIKNITYGLNEVMKLRPVNYKWKGTNQKDFGFLAQEVKLILPEIVYGEEGQMTMSYGQMTAVLTKAVQELNTLNAEKDKKIADLETRLKRLELIMGDKQYQVRN